VTFSKELRLLVVKIRAVMAFCFAVACASAPPAAAPGPKLPEYTPEEAALFDDVLVPPLFGVDVGRVDPRGDKKFSARTRSADFVAPVRVATIARDGASYRLTLELTEPPLVGSIPVPEFDVLVTRGSSSYGLLDANRHSWVNTRLVLFGRRYSLGGEPVLHFRGELDTPEVRTAVTTAGLFR
jgi:hypothetical protein